MNPPRPLDAFPLVRTGDLDELRASLARVFVEPEIELVGREHTLRVVVNHCGLRHIGLNYVSYGADIRFRYPESNYFGQVFPIGGRADVVVDGASVTIDSRHSVLFSADSTFTMTSNAAYERLFVTLDAAALAQKLAALTGVPIASPLKMHPEQDLARGPAQILRKNLMFLVDQLSAGASLPPSVLAEFEQTLMAMFLHANRHNYSHLLEAEPPGVAPWQVRRAAAHIEANGAHPLNLEDLAAATGVSIRSLARDFRRSRGQSPAEFLHQLRLRRAREMLRHAEPDATVRDIAFACGFFDLAGFVGDYCKAFGEHPSAALHRNRGPGPTRH